MTLMDIWKNHCLKTDDIDEISLMAKNVQLDMKNRCLKLNY